MSLCNRLFAMAGNTLHPTAQGFQCGHEPVHSSQSGTCVAIDATKDLWYCRSCHAGGGPVEAVMSVQGLSRTEATTIVQTMGGTISKRAGPKGDKESHLAAHLAAQYQDVLAYDGATQCWLAYGAQTLGIWSPLDTTAPDDSALARIQRDLELLRPEGFSWNFCRGVERLLRLKLLTRFPPCPPTCLPVLNGLLDLTTLRVEPYTPAHHLTWCVPFPWDATATCPQTLAWLKDATQGDTGMIAVLRAYLKAILLGRTDLQRFVELIGPGGSGKGTYVRLATALVGVRNTYATELKRLESSRFETANLRGKRLICITDAERFAGEVNVLKALTGGDVLPFEEKFKQARNGIAEGLVLIASNEAIMSADYTSGLSRRRITIPFFHQPAQRTDLLSLCGDAVHGTLAENLPGVLVWVLTLSDDRMEAVLRQTTTAVKRLAQAQAHNLVRVNPLAQWADQHLLYDATPDADGKLPKTYVGQARRYQPKDAPATYENLDTWLYANYRDFTDAVNNKPISMRRFSDILEDLCTNQLHLAGVEHTRDKHGAYFTGLRLRPEDDFDSPRLITPEPGDGSGSASDGWGTDQTRVDAGSDEYDGWVQAHIEGEETHEHICARVRGCPLFSGGSNHPSHPSYSPLTQENQWVNLSPDSSLFLFDPSPEAEDEAERAALADETPVDLAPSLWEWPPVAQDSVSVTIGGHTELPDVEYITTAQRLQEVLPELLAAPRLGLDTETTGLDPLTAQLRLVQLALPTRTILIDVFQVPLPPLTPVFTQPAITLLGHNLKFDLKFLVAAGLPWPAVVEDTMLLAQLLGAAGQRQPKGYYSLDSVVDRVLGQQLDKTLQTSDWRGDLSPAQLRYAARDAAVLLPLADMLAAECRAAGLEHVMQIEKACLPALAWLELAGVPLDAAAWQDRAAREVHRAQAVEAELYATLRRTTHGHSSLFPEAINWGSPAQVLEVLEQLGHPLTTTDSTALSALAPTEPLAALVLDYREAQKRASTYGEAWLRNHLHSMTHRVHADYLQLGSVAGRMSCTSPNMQQLPRGPVYRSCVRAEVGHCIVKADYSQIELRIAALVAQETAMLTAFQAGEDLHRLTAARVLGRAPETVTSADRQLAKALNFGLLYGMGATRLREYAFTNYKVSLTESETQQHRGTFFQLYPALRQWHQATGAALQQSQAIETRTLAQRRRVDVAKYTEALNTPIQGTGADGMKGALARLFAHRAEVPDARLIMCVHDEIVAECPQEQAEETAQWLQTHMTTAMDEIVGGAVPIAVETTIGRDWAGTPLPTAGVVS